MYNWPIKSDKPQHQEYHAHISGNNAPIMGHRLVGIVSFGINSDQVEYITLYMGCLLFLHLEPYFIPMYTSVSSAQRRN